MDQLPLELGAVYRPDFDERLIRVVAFDDSVVMCDVWWPDIRAWGWSAAKAAGPYLQVPKDFFLQHVEYLRTDEYTDEEHGLHRPDLPLSYAQVVEQDWPARLPEGIADAMACLKTRQPRHFADDLPVPRVYLEPFGPSGSNKPGVLVEASNGLAFTETELLWRAWQIQTPLLDGPLPVRGMGLYRSGLRKMIPSYSIWGSETRCAPPSTRKGSSLLPEPVGKLVKV